MHFPGGSWSALTERLAGEARVASPGEGVSRLGHVGVKGEAVAVLGRRHSPEQSEKDTKFCWMLFRNEWDCKTGAGALAGSTRSHILKVLEPP